MIIQIRKLTPPQIAALREAFPKCVESGTLTTTNSIATFDPPPIVRRSLGGELTLLKLRSAVWMAAIKAGFRGPLVAVLEKIDHRPDLVTETESA